MKRVLTCLLILTLAGCGVKLPGQPDPADREKLPEQIKEFGSLYSHNCAGCHGKDGRLGVAPPLNDPLFLAIVPDDELLMIVYNGRHGTLMPAMTRPKGGTLTAEQVEIVASGLKKRWGKSKVTAEGVPPYLSPGGGDAKAGAKVFARACAGCHGENGEGAMEGAINDQAFLGLISDQALRRIIITGRPDLDMPNYAESMGRGKDFKPLTDREVSDLVAFVTGWRRSEGDKR